MTSVEAQARNRLLFLLLFAAGSVDALSYLFLRVFPANMTGNTALLGIALVQHDVVHLRGSAIAPSRSRWALKPVASRRSRWSGTRAAYPS